MKFIFVVRQLSPGGAESATLILGKELASLGHAVEIWNIGNKKEPYRYLWEDWATVKKISKWSLITYCKKNDEHMILVNNVGHKYVGIDSAISILHGDCCHDLKNTTSYIKKIKEIAKIYNRFSRRKSITISKTLSIELGVFTKYPPQFIPNPFDSDYVIEKSKDTGNTHLLPEPYIVHIGRMSIEKRQAFLLQEYVKNKYLNETVELVFIGGEHKIKHPLIPNLQIQAKEALLSAKIHFLGNQDNPWKTLKNAKCLVLCSEYESMGYVLLEAMALGIPIVSTDTLGAMEVLGDSFPGLVKDNESLSMRIAEALINPEKFILPLPAIYNKHNVAHNFIGFMTKKDNLINNIDSDKIATSAKQG